MSIEFALPVRHHRLGETTRAKDYLAWAIRWSQAQRDLTTANLEELNVFRAEAEELLRTKKVP